jgi:ElaB/YqjD/DUF883 family membrane-anchored ribosome-binding protein
MAMQEKTNLKEQGIERVREAAGKAGDYVDNATTSLGRSIESAAGAISSRTESATDGLAKAGRYLQDADARQMGRDITHFVKDHPTVSIAAGFGLGLLIGRAISR